MKLKTQCFILGIAAILGAGCKKSLVPSSNLSPTQKAYPSTPILGFPLKAAGMRLVAFDDDDGTGLSNLLSYDDVGGSVNLIHVGPDGTLTNVWQQQNYGFMIDNTTPALFPVGEAAWGSGATDNYNEVGGVHVTALDLTGSGHFDHIVVYVPGKGVALILRPSTITPGWWHMVWPTSGGTYSTSGIGGYDLKDPHDKIIAYGINSPSKNGLVIYRPGNGIFFVVQNQGANPSVPTWVGVVRNSKGLGNFDLRNYNDQIIAVGSLTVLNDLNWDLVGYRPGTGQVWYFHHLYNANNFTQTWTSSTGLTGAPLNQIQDRILPYDGAGPADDGVDGSGLLCYRPGAGPNTEYMNNIAWNGAGASGAPLSTGNFNYPLNLNPYGSPTTYEGDKMLCIQGNNGTSTLVCYQNGTNFAQIWQEATPGVYGQYGEISYQQIY